MTAVVLVFISAIIVYYYSAGAHLSIYAEELLLNNTNVESRDPYVTDSNFTVETVATGLKIPSDWHFSPMTSYTNT